jgi:type VI secretion system protein ImpK
MVGKLNLERAINKEHSYLLSYFEAFMFQVLEARELIVNKSWGTIETAIDSTPGDSDREVLEFAEKTQKELESTLRMQALEASRFGGEFGVTAYEEVQYIMASLADEVFLSLNWNGRRYWEDNLLESKLFGTHDAGDLFFTKLENFLNRRDKLLKDIAEIYFLALGLGFLGKYRGQDDAGALDHYKKQLFLFMNNRPYMLYEAKESLFSNAYGYTLAEGKSVLLEDMRQWFFIFGGVFLLMLFISIIVWYHGTSDTFHMIDRIDTIIKAIV